MCFRFSSSLIWPHLAANIAKRTLRPFFLLPAISSALIQLK